jgi:hypothetical protein
VRPCLVARPVLGRLNALCPQRSCLLITLHYIDQICARFPSFTLSSLTCHRFVITAIAVSSKALCDAFCTNSLYARVGGIPVGELNMLEREFLRMIDWSLTVSRPRRPLGPPSRTEPFTPQRLPPSLPSSSPRVRTPQCTREVLQEYYASLVRTHSRGAYVLAGADAEASSVSSDSDMDYEDPASRPATPPPGGPARPQQASTILVDAASVAHHEPPRPPTVEQNMAYAAFRQQAGPWVSRRGQG